MVESPKYINNLLSPHTLTALPTICELSQVLNMWPQEVLGMVEEVARTHMFKEHKDKAKKTMGKKDKHIQEIKDILGEERQKRSPPSSSSTNSIPKALLHSILKIHKQA